MMNLKQITLFGTLVLSGAVIPTTLDAGPFDPIITEGGGWKESGWLGWYYDGYYPFVLHAQHGFQYAQEWQGWVWLYDYGLSEWFATSGEVYPMLFEWAGNKWIWYYEGSQSPRRYVEVGSSELYTEFSGVLMPKLMKDAFDGALMLTSGMDGVDTGQAMTEVMELVMLPLFGDPATSECPVITRIPEEISLFEPPSTITATADFGTGCAPGENLGMIAGSLDLIVTDLVFSEELTQLNIDLLATNVTREGIPLLDGGVSVNLSMTGSEEESETDTHYVTTSDSVLLINVSLDNLSVLDQVMNGSMSLDADIHTVESENKLDWDDVSEAVSGTMNLTLEALTTAQFGILSGTVAIEMAIPGTTLLTFDMTSDNGPIEMELSLSQNEDGSEMQVNTVGTASLFGYTVTINDLLWDEATCIDYPVSGVITIGFEGLNYVIVISPSCDGSFTISKGW